MRRQIYNLLLMIGVATFLISMWTGKLVETGRIKRLQEDTVTTTGYREQNLGEEMLKFIKGKSEPGYYVGIYLLESKFGYQEWNESMNLQTFQNLEKKWKKQKAWDSYLETTTAIWNDVKYFPVPESTTDSDLTVSYANSWMAERTYGGKRGHEGTDIMADENVRGLYPIISMTDGVIVNKGWLEKGGYRIGVESPNGAYFYYAHLDSYASNIEEGDTVKAGDILGFMGDSGYGPEGTTGQFAVHLHLGIYIYPDGEEISVNPYWVLRYIENRKVKCYTEI